MLTSSPCPRSHTFFQLYLPLRTPDENSLGYPRMGCRYTVCGVVMFCPCESFETCLALLTQWPASVRALSYWYLFCDPRRWDNCRKVCAPRRISVMGAPHVVTWTKQTWTYQQCTQFATNILVIFFNLYCTHMNVWWCHNVREINNIQCNSIHWPSLASPISSPTHLYYIVSPHFSFFPVTPC